jgi:hypothetical protein
MDSMDAEVSVWLAEAFIAIIGAFTWVGGAIANSIYSVEDSCYPWDHGWALLKSLPLGILSLGILLVAILVAMQIPFPEALGFIGLGYGAWVRWLVTSREGRSRRQLLLVEPRGSTSDGKFPAMLTSLCDCSSSGNLRLIRHFEKRGSGSSGVRV